MSDAEFGVKTLVQRVSSVAGGSAIAQLLSGIAYVIAARTLGPARFGTYASGIAIATVTTVTFDFGLGALIVREVAARRLTQRVARVALDSKRALALVVVAPLAIALIVIVHDVVSAIALSLMFLASWEALMANALLRSEERFAAGIAGQVGGRGVGLAVVWVLAVALSSEAALPIGLCVGFALEATVDRVLLRSRPRRPRGWDSWWSLQIEASSYGFAALGAAGQQMDTPLVALGGGSVSAGLYAAAGRLLGPLGFLSSALGSVAAPWLARAHIDASSLRREERKVASIALCLAVAPLCAALAGPLVIPVILGPRYRSSGVVLAVLAGGSVLSTLNQSTAAMVQNRRSQGWVAISIALGLLTGLIATYFFARIGGAIAAAWGYTISQLIMLLLLQARLRSLRHGSSGALR
jgi:O-antigen/teichoic acid export membrane protein